MTLYKSLLRSMNMNMCQTCALKFIKHELVSLKLIKVNNYKQKSFSTSTIKQVRTQIKKVKDSKNQTRPEVEYQNIPNSTSSASLLIKPFAFTIFFSGASFAGTAIWQYENVRAKALLLLQKNWFTDQFARYGRKKYSWRQEINKYWNKLSEGQKLFAPICFINVLVFLAWKVKRFQPTMIKYFCCSPYGEIVCWPMVLSAFSHYSFIHLAANMSVLYSFSTSGVEDLGKEQFLGLYLAGGVISSFASYAYKVIRSQHTVSIGASGAIMAMVAYICMKYPESSLSVIFLPWLVFPAGTGIKCIMCMDILGTIRGWTYLDHAAHLGGSLSGMGWCYWGNTHIWQNREPLLEWWHSIRSSK